MRGYFAFLCFGVLSHCCNLCVYMLILCFRFQVLRNIIPQSDQKRDKASLLLEVHCLSIFGSIFVFVD